MSFEAVIAGLARRGGSQPAQPGFSVAPMVLPPPGLPQDEVSAVLKALQDTGAPEHLYRPCFASRENLAFCSHFLGLSPQPPGRPDISLAPLFYYLLERGRLSQGAEALKRFFEDAIASAVASRVEEMLKSFLSDASKKLAARNIAAVASDAEKLVERIEGELKRAASLAPENIVRSALAQKIETRLAENLPKDIAQSMARATVSKNPEEIVRAVTQLQAPEQLTQSIAAAKQQTQTGAGEFEKKIGAMLGRAAQTAT